MTYNNIVAYPIVVPENPRVKAGDEEIGLGLCTGMGVVGVVQMIWVSITPTSVDSVRRNKEQTMTYFGHQFWTIPASQTCSG